MWDPVFMPSFTVISGMTDNRRNEIAGAAKKGAVHQFQDT